MQTRTTIRTERDTRFDLSNARKVRWSFTTERKEPGGGRKQIMVTAQNAASADTEDTTAYFDEAGRSLPCSPELVREYEAKGYEKSSCMYIWQSAIEQDTTKDGYPVVTMGRTYEELKQYFENVGLYAAKAYYGYTPLTEEDAVRVLRQMKKNRGKPYRRPLVRIGIHNMGYDFQFLRNAFEGKIRQVFARTERKPMKFRISTEFAVIECYDTLVLVQKKLAKWCEDDNLPVKKLTGDLDYSEIRTPLTPLSKKELAYCEHDVVAMVYGLKQYRVRYGTAQSVPMTQTGSVRRICKAATKGSEWEERCKDTLAFYDLERYKLVSNYVYSGGWTHANRKYSMLAIKALVYCFDFSSSFPAVMCICRYPVSRFEAATPEAWHALQSLDVNARPKMGFGVFRFSRVKCKLWNTFFSSSKCIESSGVIEDNGKVYAADSLTVALTDLDYDVFTKAYEFEGEPEPVKIYLADADYLPWELVSVILDRYKAKTALKGNEARKSEYIEGKQLINSIYGCAVTKTITDEVTFAKALDDAGKYLGYCKWGKKYLESKDGSDDDGQEHIFFEDKVAHEMETQQFLSYQIGVWVTAWARHNLWDAILALDEWVIYGDTDSIKARAHEGILEWFDAYNRDVVQKRTEAAMSHYGIDDPEVFAPLTQKGKAKPLGYFDREADAVEFRTMGAKRYCYRTADGKMHVVVAGLPAVDPADPDNRNDPEDPRGEDDLGLPNAWKGKIRSVDDFNDGLFWDETESCKVTLAYEDDQKPRVFTDKYGKAYECKDRFGITMTPTTFSMGLGEEYRDFMHMLLAFGHLDEDTRIITKDLDMSKLR